ncbi:choice-of-anchor V domain-containing protein [Lacinutrix iliipiscaria]|uniref:Choice-of-anchor V domain-containing protein n=1 Tax=Lacinutrix iliipiscaria TaxID=1230532 RepID=A0ABW5WMS7_9FLAO
MKKNYSFYLSLLGIPVFAILFLSFGAGQNAFYVSGSPSDIAENSPGDCTFCHTGNPVITDSPTITLTVPSDYDLNTTYNITVASGSGASRQGFQMSAEDGSGNKVGDFRDDGTNSQVFDLGRGEAITHTGSGAFNQPWSFEWTSPASDVGPVTFYVALNESNIDFNSTGDQIHLKQSSATLSVDTAIFENLKVYPNPSQDMVTIDLPSQLEGNTNITVYDFLGKQILSKELNTISNTVDVSAWQSGVYLMQLTNEKAAITKRFVKQ